MTPSDHDPLPDDGPLDDDTLAVHAVVDDEASPAQRRRVAGDPELVARVADLRSTVAAVAAPVDPPARDVLAALRGRALDALDETETEPPASEEASPYAPPPPARDLAAARARRSRSLPPLPAVAAVVVILLMVGVGLVFAGTTGGDEETADRTSAELDSSGGAGAGEDSGAGGDEATSEEAAGSNESTAEDGSGDAAEGARPSDEAVEALLARSSSRYDDDESLLAELRRSDDGLPFAAGGEAAPSTPTAPSTTTAPADGDDTQDGLTAASRSATALASDPIVMRCDDVLRAAEPELEPVTAAALVDVAGVPVLVLSNPMEASDVAPAGIRLTVLNALDCSPRAAVVR